MLKIFPGITWYNYMAHLNYLKYSGYLFGIRPYNIALSHTSHVKDLNNSKFGKNVSSLSGPPEAVFRTFLWRENVRISSEVGLNELTNESAFEIS